VEEERVACRPVRPDITCGETITPQEPTASLPPHHSARLVWEVFTGGAAPWKTLEPVASSAQPASGQAMDSTRALTLDGIVEINLPPTMVQTSLGAVATPLFYVRCRLLGGAFDTPPIILDIAPNSVAAEQAVPVWHTFAIAAGVVPAGPVPQPAATQLATARLDMHVDATGMIQALTFFDPAPAPSRPDIAVLAYVAPVGGTPGQLTIELDLVGVGDGRPDQTALLPHAPLLVENLRLFTHAAGTWQEWERRDDLDASHRTDLHFVLDAMSGEIQFGTGERGRVPADGALILAAYRATQADRGNVGAGAVTRPASPTTSPRNTVLLAALQPTDRAQLSRVTINRAPARGGAATEDVIAAIGRVVETIYAHQRLLDLCAEMQCHSLDQVNGSRVRAIKAPTRAVNLLDIERMALDVPGTRVARARAWAALHPDYPCLDAAGVVTVVILPDMPVASPEPSQGLLDAVWRYLNRRRMLCTRLFVVGPRYLMVQVQARVRVRPGAKAARVRQDIVSALDRFLDPCTGGPDGLGWPFGRDVYRSEILKLLHDVPGMDHVLDLSLSAIDGEPQCGNLPLCPTWLVAHGTYQIDVG
jgi:hypothetical protein